MSNLSIHKGSSFMISVRNPKVKSMLRLLTLAIVIVLSNAPSSVMAVALTWDNGSSNMLWSDSGNWNPDSPASGNDITFDNSVGSGTVGVTTNIVDASVAINSLNYINTNGTGNGPPPTIHQTTVINSGETLTVNGNLSVGNPNLTGTTVTMRGSTLGTGSLFVNNTSANIHVNPGGAFYTPAHTVTFDMSGLGSFTANVNALRVGTVDGGITTMNLATTNVITANEVTVGLNGWNGGGTMRLGQTNTINTDLLRVSAPSPQSGYGTINFNTGLTNPTVQLRAKDGVSRIANVQVGYVSNTSGPSPGLLDFNGGSVNALFGAVALGISDANPLGQSRSGSGTLQFNAGTIDATSITMSTAGPWNGGAATAQVTSGVLTVAGTGTLIADTITMTVRNSGTAGLTSATVNLNGTGTLRATTIGRGAALGTGTSSIAFNFNGGTLAHKSGTDLAVDQFVPISILTGSAHNFDAAVARQITINSNVIGAGTGAVNKTGAGKLLMLGTNTYVAPTNVQAGTLGGTGSSTSDFTVASGATLAPGASAGTLLTDDLTMQNGSTLEIELGGLTAGTQYDRVLSSGAINLDGNLVVKMINGFSPTSANTFTIMQGLSVVGEFDSVTVVGTPGYFDVTYLSNAVILSNFQVPEPSTMSLVGMAGLGMIAWRRRRRNQAESLVG
jgi:autotransporter-associated beta strand protein